MPDEPIDAALAAEASAAPPPPPPAAEPEPDDDVDPVGEDLPDSAKEMIRKAREEAAARRVEHKPYKEAFQGFEDNERSYLLDVIRMAAGSEEEQKFAASEFQRIAAVLTGEEMNPEEAEQAVADSVAGEETPAEAPAVSPDDIQKMITQALEEDRKIRAQEQEVDQKVAQIREKAKGLGFEHGTPKYQVLMTIARSQTNGDLEAAAEAYKEMVAAETAPPEPEPETRWPTVPSSVGNPPPAGGKPEWVGDVKKTSEALKEWLTSRPG